MQAHAQGATGANAYYLKEAVRFDIVDEGEPLTEEKIHEIVHSEPYKELLLAFDIRR